MKNSVKVDDSQVINRKKVFSDLWDEENKKGVKKNGNRKAKKGMVGSKRADNGDAQSHSRCSH